MNNKKTEAKKNNKTVIDIQRCEFVNILTAIDAYLDHPELYSRHDTRLGLHELMKKAGIIRD